MLDLLFETSWEVCNKVGGIYAVLSTKAKTLQKKYKDRVVFIGPDVWTPENESPFFTECKTPLDAWRRQAVLPQGMTVRVGRWNVPGKPIAVLVSYNSLYSYKNELYAEMWDQYRVDSLHAYGDYDESCMFAYGAALVIESIVLWSENAKRVVAHFDEWTTGMGLLCIKSHMPWVGTVFTTHATSIGRSICGNGKPLYDYMSGYNGDQMAGELNMQSKHSLEKAAAHAADAFTTVSEVTARECEQLLERRPMVTPNAFEPTFVPKGAKMRQARQQARERMLTVARALTGTDFAPDTLIVATSGRCEYRNKGLDVCLDALSGLRSQLEDGNATRKAVAFVFVPAWVDAARPDLAKAVACGDGTGLPDPVVTHSIYNPDSDSVYCRIKSLGFTNGADSAVTVIYVPSYLNGTDGIFNMAYYDLLAGVDVTMFPSYYEPWGYTPLESVAFGVPTVTTNLSGFGQWVLSTCGDDFAQTGVRVVPRTDSSYHDTVNGVQSAVLDAWGWNSATAQKVGRNAQKTAKLATWDKFMAYYYEAYDHALECAAARKK